jgi:chromatin remodeling complex protein RSC6
MSIRPIDMQTLLPRLQMMKAASELEINKHNNDLTDLEKETRQLSEEKANKVNKSDRKETDQLKNDTSGRKEQQKRKSKKRDKEREEENERKLSNKGTRFDMKV